MQLLIHLPSAVIMKTPPLHSMGKASSCWAGDDGELKILAKENRPRLPIQTFGFEMYESSDGRGKF